MLVSAEGGTASLGVHCGLGTNVSDAHLFNE